jgi:hypothetical protein
MAAKLQKNKGITAFYAQTCLPRISARTIIERYLPLPPKQAEANLGLINLANDAQFALTRGDQQGPAAALLRAAGSSDYSPGALPWALPDRVDPRLFGGRAAAPRRLRSCSRRPRRSRAALGAPVPAKVAWSLGGRIGAAFSPALASDHPALVGLQRAATIPPAAAAARARWREPWARALDRKRRAGLAGPYQRDWP